MFLLPTVSKKLETVQILDCGFTSRLTKILPIIHLGVSQWQNLWNQIGLPDAKFLWGSELITIQGCPEFIIGDLGVKGSENYIHPKRKLPGYIVKIVELE